MWPISRSSALVNAAWAGPRRPSTTTSSMPDAAQRLQRVLGGVGALQLGGLQREHAGHVRGHVAVADDHGAPARQRRVQLAAVRVAVVPAHEIGGGQRAGQVLARDAQRLVGLGAHRVDDRVVVAHQVGVRDVRAHLDVAQEAAARAQHVAVEGLVQALDLVVVGRHAAAQQAPRGGQALVQVHLGAAADAQQPRGRERARRPGADDGHPPVAHSRPTLRCSKNWAFRSSA